MNAVEILKDVYWVGAIDWNIRNFHGYLTQRGTTYNSYLIIDEEITLIDTVKITHKDELLKRISSIIDPSKIDNIICNHVEMDHSGSLVDIAKLCPNAKIYCSQKAVEGLKLHYNYDFNLFPVKTGDSINIGERTLQFVSTPMVHWPDNMVTYCGKDKILFSNDGFGQHIASVERFDDQYSQDISIEEAKKYYANIVLPFSNMVKNELKATQGLDISIIAPSHGLIWRKNVGDIVEKYSNWSKNIVEEKAVIVYDTMWGSTQKIALGIADYFEKQDVKFEIINLQKTHISDVMTYILESKYICVGSPTLNNNMLPTVGGFLTYLKGLAPKNRIGLAFGSYGWSGQSIGLINNILRETGLETKKMLKYQYIPSEEDLEQIALEAE